jgi:phosphohistidine swiveling domain-containing protein
MIALAEATDPARVGGKAAALGELIRAGFRVPPGEVLPREAFDAFVAPVATGIEQILGALDASDPLALERGASEIAALLLGRPVPSPRLSGAGLSGPIAVRSSAVGEDTGSASFAGQLDSCLDVRSDGVDSAIRRVWTSLYGARCLAYQHARSARLETMGVIVQQQIEGLVSGVLFTEDPDDRDRLRLEYCEGMGEALVSGRVVPHSFGLDEPRELPLLESAVVSDLLDVGKRIAQLRGGPQDIEWTWDGQQLWVLQARPITTEWAVYSNANINENYPGPVIPLLQSIARTSYQHYFRTIAESYGFAPRRVAAMDRAFANLVEVHGQRLYYDVSNIHAVLRMAPMGDTFAEMFNGFVGVSSRTEPRASDVTWVRGSAGRAKEVAELAWMGLSVTRSYARLTRRVEAFEETVDRYAQRTREPETLLDALLDQVEGFLDIRRYRWRGPALADGACMVCTGLLQRFLERHFDEPGDVLMHGLLRGLPDIVSSEPPKQLWRLSRQIRTAPGLGELFTRSTPEVLSALGWDGRRFDAQQPFALELQGFLDDWGFRCTGELMLTVDSFQEQPAAMIDMLRSYATVDDDGPDAVIARQAAARIAQTEALAARLPATRRWALRTLLDATARSLALRERARLKQALLYRRFRRVVLALGARLHEQGRMGAPDDVLFLTWPELLSLRRGDADSATIGERRRRFVEESAWPEPPPRLVRLRGRRWVPDLSSSSAEGRTPAADPTVLRGLAAAAGRITARATVARSQQDFHKVAAGDILVAPQTDPGWATVLFLVKGLVTERGGLLSHGAIIAREFGIPSVVAVDRATERIPQHAVIELDGDLGHVRILE